MTDIGIFGGMSMNGFAYSIYSFGFGKWLFFNLFLIAIPTIWMIVLVIFKWRLGYNGRFMAKIAYTISWLILIFVMVQFFAMYFL